MSCCARGGSWFNICGGAGNKRLPHTWSEGIRVCNAQIQSKIVVNQRDNVSSHGADNATFKEVNALAKMLVVTPISVSVVPSVIAPAQSPVNNYTVYSMLTTQSKPITRRVDAPDDMSTVTLSITTDDAANTVPNRVTMSNNVFDIAKAALEHKRFPSQACGKLLVISVQIGVSLSVVLF